MSEPAPTKRLRLQRLTDALRRRDWLGLVFEVLVVTLGVLLAFEIEQWAQERQRAADERRFLERLYSEYGRAARELRTVIGHHDRVVHAHRLAFEARNDPMRLLDYSAAENENIGCRAGYLGTALFSDTVSQELISSGKLDRITDPRLRAKVRDLTTMQEWLKDRADGAREVARDQNPFVIRHYRYEILPDGRSTCRIRWAELFNDPNAVTAAIRMYRMHELVGSGRKDLLRETLTVRKDIGTALGKPEHS